MRYLLDTHVWLWWTSGSPRITPALRALLDGQEHEIFFSAASAWEIAIKYGSGKLPLPKSPELFVEEQITTQGMIVLPISVAHATEVAKLPKHHLDPFDRLLITQCILEKMTLITADQAMRRYEIALYAVH